jgi:hypothetical protein
VELQAKHLATAALSSLVADLTSTTAALPDRPGVCCRLDHSVMRNPFIFVEVLPLKLTHLRPEMVPNNLTKLREIAPQMLI